MTSDGLMKGQRKTSPHIPKEQRFWTRVSMGLFCWEWQGAVTPKGYGVLREKARNFLAHRLSWEMAHGPIPNGLCVMHRCDNPRCVNPGHLFLGTIADNNHDMISKGRHRPRGKKPLTEEQQMELVARAIEGEKRATLAADYGLSLPGVDRILRLRRKHMEAK